MRDSYMQLLLEIRQGLSDTESDLLSSACIDIRIFREVKRFKALIQQEIINYRIGFEPNNYLLKYMRG